MSKRWSLLAFAIVAAVAWPGAAWTAEQSLPTLKSLTTDERNERFDWRTYRKDENSKYANKKQAAVLLNALVDAGCYDGEKEDLTWWGEDSYKAFGTFLTSAKQTIDDSTQKKSPFKTVADVHAMIVAFKDKGGSCKAKCDLPALRRKWVEKRDNEVRSTEAAASEKSPFTGLEALQRALDVADRNFKTYVPPPSDEIEAVTPDPSAYASTRLNVRDSVNQLSQELRRSLNYAASSESPSCRQCILLASFQTLKNGALYDVLDDGNLFGREIFPLKEITFDMLSAQAGTIRVWESQRADSRLGDPNTTLTSILVAFRSAKSAKVQQPAPEEMAANYDNEYAANCSDFITEIVK